MVGVRGFTLTPKSESGSLRERGLSFDKLRTNELSIYLPL